MSPASDSRTRAVTCHHIEAKPAATGAKAYLSGEDACRYLNLQASHACVNPATPRDEASYADALYADALDR